MHGVPDGMQVVAANADLSMAVRSELSDIQIYGSNQASYVDGKRVIPIRVVTLGASLSATLTIERLKEIGEGLVRLAAAASSGLVLPDGAKLGDGHHD